jgi:hypothetical protein
MDRLQAAGGHLDYFSMDDPLASFVDYSSAKANCFVNLYGGIYPEPPDSYGKAAGILASFMQRVKDRHSQTFPNDQPLQVGLSDAYPDIPEKDLEGYIQAMIDQGAKPAFFHVDADPNLASSRNLNLAADMVKLKAFCEAREIPFGVIFIGQTNASAQAYHDSLMNWFRQIHSAIGAPDQIMMQSWWENPGADPFAVPRTLPNNLPMTDPNSGMSMLLEGLGILGVNSASSMVHSLPWRHP